MELGEKLRHLRAVEGGVRGLARPLTKAEVARAMRVERGAGLSEASLSQLESGRRAHLTAPTRALLARFFKVHPGYLVGDPAGYERMIRTEALRGGSNLRDWLAERAAECREDPPLSALLSRLATRPDPRRDLLRLGPLLDLMGETDPPESRNGHSPCC